MQATEGVLTWDRRKCWLWTHLLSLVSCPDFQTSPSSILVHDPDTQKSRACPKSFLTLSDIKTMEEEEINGSGPNECC